MRPATLVRNIPDRTRNLIWDGISENVREDTSEFVGHWPRMLEQIRVEVKSYVKNAAETPVVESKEPL